MQATNSFYLAMLHSNYCACPQCKSYWESLSSEEEDVTTARILEESQNDVDQEE